MKESEGSVKAIGETDGKAAGKAAGKSTGKADGRADERVRRMAFGTVYPLYVQKVEKKGRTRQEVDQVISWLTGYDGPALRRIVDDGIDFERFFAEAPRFNPNASKITGLICGYRVEEIGDPFMRKVRQMDKLVDELAKGKAMDSILRK